MLVPLVLIYWAQKVFSLKTRECISVLNRFKASLTKEQTGDQETIEKHFTNFCNDLKLNENHFCY